jgi:hypothetical protein
MGVGDCETGRAPALTCAREPEMAEYRLFQINDAGHIDTASTAIVCETDDQAIAKAKTLNLGPKVEVWQGSRTVAVLAAAVEDIASHQKTSLAHPPEPPGV